ncbi:MAG: hypothetical protein AAF337_04055 [Pseudomonadota bacterium]
MSDEAELDLEAINQPKRAHLQPGHVDNVARALLSLTQEVCVLTDRLAVLEDVLATKGIDVAEEVDTYQPTPEQQARIKARTQRIIEGVTSALQGR